jgi:hypothetical protein
LIDPADGSDAEEICLDPKLAVSIVESLKDILDCVEDCNAPIGRLSSVVTISGMQKMLLAEASRVRK